jgi:hypothetical protein
MPRGPRNATACAIGPDSDARASSAALPSSSRHRGRAGTTSRRAIGRRVRIERGQHQRDLRRGASKKQRSPPPCASSRCADSRTRAHRAARSTLRGLLVNERRRPAEHVLRDATWCSWPDQNNRVASISRTSNAQLERDAHSGRQRHAARRSIGASAAGFATSRAFGARDPRTPRRGGVLVAAARGDARGHSVRGGKRSRRERTRCERRAREAFGPSASTGRAWRSTTSESSGDRGIGLRGDCSQRRRAVRTTREREGPVRRPRSRALCSLSEEALASSRQSSVRRLWTNPESSKRPSSSGHGRVKPGVPRTPCLALRRPARRAAVVQARSRTLPAASGGQRFDGHVRRDAMLVCAALDATTLRGCAADDWMRTIRRHGSRPGRPGGGLGRSPSRSSKRPSGPCGYARRAAPTPGRTRKHARTTDIERRARRSGSAAASTSPAPPPPPLVNALSCSLAEARSRVAARLAGRRLATLSRIELGCRSWRRRARNSWPAPLGRRRKARARAARRDFAASATKRDQDQRARRAPDLDTASLRALDGSIAPPCCPGAAEGVLAWSMRRRGFRNRKSALGARNPTRSARTSRWSRSHHPPIPPLAMLEPRPKSQAHVPRRSADTPLGPRRGAPP